jgi:hypothetical protein
MYRSNDNLEELRRLRCGEKVEVLSRSVDYVQVRAIDGRVGWVNGAELSNYPGAPPSKSLGVGDSGARQQAASGGALDNAAIEKMRTQRLGADVIVAKIKSSPCHFDTSPAALQKLKQSGIPDKVILAMVMAPSSSSSAPLTAPKAPEFVDVQVPAGTQIDLELKYAASSDEAADGRPILLIVTHDVAIDGAVVFRAGAEAHARVVSFKEPGFMNRPPGSLAWTMDYVTAANGDHVPADFYSKEAAENPMTATMGAPGPSWEFKKGKPAFVEAKTKFQAVLNKKGTTVRVAQRDEKTPTVADAGDAGPASNGKP